MEFNLCNSFRIFDLSIAWSVAGGKKHKKKKKWQKLAELSSRLN